MTIDKDFPGTPDQRSSYSQKQQLVDQRARDRWNSTMFEREAYALTQSFTGTDCLAYAVIPARFEHEITQYRTLLSTTPAGKGPWPLGSLQTLSYSSHRPVFGVQRAHHVRPVHYTNATRTIGGTMIFSVFDANVLVEMYRNFYGDMESKSAEQIIADTTKSSKPTGNFSGAGAAVANVAYSETNKFLVNAGVKEFAELADELPPIDIHIMGINEVGHQTYMALFNVKFLDESMTVSINDTFTEHVVQFVCSSVTPLQTQTRRIESRDKLFSLNAFANNQEEAAAIEAELDGEQPIPPPQNGEPIPPPQNGEPIPPPQIGAGIGAIQKIEQDPEPDALPLDHHYYALGNGTIINVTEPVDLDTIPSSERKTVAAKRMRYIEIIPGYWNDPALLTEHNNIGTEEFGIVFRGTT